MSIPGVPNSVGGAPSRAAGKLGNPSSRSSALDKAGSYLVGAVTSRITDAIARAGLKVPNDVKGALGYLFGDDAQFDPLQNLMFRVQLGDANFHDSVIKEVSIPNASFQVKSVRQKGKSVNYVQGRTVGDLSITFYETRTMSIATYYDELCGKVYDKGAGTFKAPNSYKKVIEVGLVDEQGNPVLSVYMTGCIPVSLSNYGMSTAGNALITPTITFKVDDIVILNSMAAPKGALTLAALQSAGASIINQAAGTLGL